jgi:hypothetical protein
VISPLRFCCGMAAAPHEARGRAVMTDVGGAMLGRRAYLPVRRPIVETRISALSDGAGHKAPTTDPAHRGRHADPAALRCLNKVRPRGWQISAIHNALMESCMRRFSSVS